IVSQIQSWLDSQPERAWMLAASLGLALACLAGVAWLRWGHRPRRRRAYQRALKFLQLKDWPHAQNAAAEIRDLGRLSATWQGRLCHLEGQTLEQAGDAALQNKEYEKSLDYYRQAAERLSLPVEELRDRVLSPMLAEVRRLFSANLGPNTAEVHTL